MSDHRKRKHDHIAKGFVGRPIEDLKDTLSYIKTEGTVACAKKLERIIIALEAWRGV